MRPPDPENRGAIHGQGRRGKARRSRRAPTPSSWRETTTFRPTPWRRRASIPSQTHTTCGWKGVASYYDVEVDGKRNRDAAWYYPDPKPAAAEIKDRIAFWKGVRVTT